MQESKIQSEAFIWARNTYPATHGVLFAVKNEGAEVSVTLLKKHVGIILKNLTNISLVKSSCYAILKHITGNVIGGSIKKAMGVVRGVADMLFIWKGNLYCFEFKTRTGRQSDAQKRWEAQATRQGAVYFIIRSVDEFKAEFKKIVDD